MNTKLGKTFTKAISILVVSFGTSLLTMPVFSKEPDCTNYLVDYSGSAHCFDDNLNPISQPFPVNYTKPVQDDALRRRSVKDSSIDGACETLSNTLSKFEYESIKSCFKISE